MIAFWVQETAVRLSEAASSGFDWIGALATLFAFGALVAAIIYGEIQRRSQRHQQQLAEEQLRLAREQAEMRPKLAASFRVIHQRLDEDFPPYDRLHVEVTNNGGTTAHNMRCWIRLPRSSFGLWEDSREPEEKPSRRSLFERPELKVPMARIERSWGEYVPQDQDPEAEWYVMQVYEKDRILPNSTRNFNIDIGRFLHDKAVVRYTLVCDEGRMTENEEVEVEVPPTKGE